MTVVVDRGIEFLAELAEIIQRDFGATRKVITTKSPQADCIIVHGMYIKLLET